MPQPIWSTRTDGINDYFNARWLAVAGIAPAEGSTGGWTALVHPNDRETAVSLWPGRCIAVRHFMRNCACVPPSMGIAGSPAAHSL